MHSWREKKTKRPKPHDSSAGTTSGREPMRGRETLWALGWMCCHLAGIWSPAILTSSQPTAGCCRWSRGSRLLAGPSCAKQPLGAAARWKGAGSAGFPPARPAAKQQTQTRGSLGFSSCRGRQRFVQAINALGWIVSLQRYSSSLHDFPRTRKPEE